MEPITVKGNHFFNSNPSIPFLIRGIDYRYDSTNSLNVSITTNPQLEDDLACRRDIPYLNTLGINTIVVDNIRPSTHGEIAGCMEQLRKAGIYVLVGIGTLSLNIQVRQAWDTDILQRFVTVVDSFMRYDNLLGFYITGSPITIPLVKGAVRDLKKYVGLKGRAIPIGYFGKIRGKDLSNALNCGEEQNSIDFLALDMGDLCDHPSKSVPMIEKAIVDHFDYSIPAFLYSRHCNSRTDSNTTMFDFLSQSNITKVMSGAVVFSYFNYNRDDDFSGLYSTS
jgi:glycosyl hydrolase family 72 (putative glucanosyltransferase)